MQPNERNEESTTERNPSNSDRPSHGDPKNIHRIATVCLCEFLVVSTEKMTIYLIFQMGIVGCYIFVVTDDYVITALWMLSQYILHLLLTSGYPNNLNK